LKLLLHILQNAMLSFYVRLSRFSSIPFYDHSVASD
jgi:hypothetical protein